MTTLKYFTQMLSGVEFLVLDTETTGLNSGEICQIAILHSSGKVLLNEYVQTKEPIPGAATRIHGITDEHVKSSPTWPELLPVVREILEGKLLVVYNAVYDRKMMHQSSERWGLNKTEWKDICTWLCAMEAFAEFYGEWNEYHGNYRWQKLGFAADLIGFPVENAHDALGDCQMTLAVTKHLLKLHTRKNHMNSESR